MMFIFMSECTMNSCVVPFQRLRFFNCVGSLLALVISKVCVPSCIDTMKCNDVWFYSSVRSQSVSCFRWHKLMWCRLPATINSSEAPYMVLFLEQEKNVCARRIFCLFIFKMHFCERRSKNKSRDKIVSVFVVANGMLWIMLANLSVHTYGS